MLPNEYAIDADDPPMIEEERRMYIALTRAQTAMMVRAAGGRLGRDGPACRT